MELNIEKFDPTVEQLTKMVAVSKKIVDVDTNDKEQLEVVRKTRIELKTARVAITKKGKEMREEALAFQKAVIAKEKELVAIIEPEESRLEAIEEEVEERKLREMRVALLPERRAKLASIDESINPEDEFLLAMDSMQFAEYVNDCVATKNENARLEIEREQARIRAEQDAIEREKEAQAREKKAREEAQEEAERKLKLAQEEAELRVQREKEETERRVKEERERIEREAKEKAEREKKEKEEADAKVKAEQEALEKKKKYQTWLADNGYSEDKKHEYHFTDNGGEIKMYKLVSVFKK